jgi:hypothetical protein
MFLANRRTTANSQSSKSLVICSGVEENIDGQLVHEFLPPFIHIFAEKKMVR